MSLTPEQETDLYQTLAKPAEGVYKEKGSKFISLAFPVTSEQDIKERLAETRKLYYDARHHCYAYLLGAAKKQFRANDDGEPNHSAGDPILGQIRAADLTNVLIIVVRYFGGTKLGVGGLVQAYKTAAAEAIAAAEIIQKHETAVFEINFGYEQMNTVMGVVKSLDLKILSQHFETDCKLKIEIRKQMAEMLQAKLKNLDGVSYNII